MKKILPIDVIRLRKSFRIDSDNRIERYQTHHGRKLKNPHWRIVKIRKGNAGYSDIRWDKQSYRYHRILWALYYGRDIPGGMQVDHKDGNRNNNAMSNLRIVRSRGNSQNQARHRAGRLIGAHFNDGRWAASIRIADRQVHLGMFATERKAHEAYIKANRLINDYISHTMKQMEVADATA